MLALCRPIHQGSTPRGTPGNFGPKWPTPCWFERRRDSIANCGRMVTDSATVTMESLKETTIALSNGAIADPYDLPPPKKNGVPYAPRYANGHISATAHSIHLYSAHRAVIFAQLSCISCDRITKPFCIVFSCQNLGEVPTSSSLWASIQAGLK